MLGKVVVWRKFGLGLKDVWKFRVGGPMWKCPKGDDLIGHWTQWTMWWMGGGGITTR